MCAGDNAGRDMPSVAEDDPHHRVIVPIWSFPLFLVVYILGTVLIQWHYSKKREWVRELVDRPTASEGHGSAAAVFELDGGGTPSLAPVGALDLAETPTWQAQDPQEPQLWQTHKIVIQM